MSTARSLGGGSRTIAGSCARALMLLCGWASLLSPATAVEIKVASLAPDGSSWMQSMRAGGEQIRARTDGRVVMKFYPGGVMGSDSQVLRKIRVGQLQGGAFAGSGLGERFSGFNLYGIPLLFESLDEVDYVRERMDATLAKGLEEAGFVSFGFVEGGFAQLMANQPIRAVEDMRRRKVWSPEGDPIGFMVLEAMGLSPVVLPPTDVLTGLQTGLLDVVAASPVVALVLQWHTKTRYVTDLPIAYGIGVFAIERRAFASLAPGDQAIVAEIMGGVMSELDKAARRDDSEARAVLERTGLEFVGVDRSDVGGWRATIESIYPALRARNDIDAALFDQLLGLIEEYRNGASAPAQAQR
ncbi:MAG TPA: TRAP transporter substrate-binding protein DctP [Gammaproteobacteria bacterium]|nr:TRAP transporter substrate-binding protein DctP [Gammaproteobacteria bacterium]